MKKTLLRPTVQSLKGEKMFFTRESDSKVKLFSDPDEGLFEASLFLLY